MTFDGDNDNDNYNAACWNAITARFTPADKQIHDHKFFQMKEAAL